ncbi:MAG: hypothetical protein ABEJ46_00105, partial [Gemmatimonadota bacterium]
GLRRRGGRRRLGADGPGPMAARRLPVVERRGRGDAGPVRSLLTLHQLSVGYRILYSGVLLFFVLGYGTGLAQQALQAGLTPDAAADWWLGNAGDPDATRLLFEKEPHLVLDAVWRRTLSNVIPVVVILALLFRSSLPDLAFRVLAIFLVATALLDLASPALIRWGGRAWGVPALAAQVGLALSAAGGAVICWRDMWIEPGERPRFWREGMEVG